MSGTYIIAGLRRLVAERAAYCCEYCRVPEGATYYGCQIDHIISEKHGGSTTDRNLAYACGACNAHKGSDIASISTAGELTRFFNPRTDAWNEHFQLSGAAILPLTAVGEVTLRLLTINSADRIMERLLLQSTGHYPLV